MRVYTQRRGRAVLVHDPQSVLMIGFRAAWMAVAGMFVLNGALFGIWASRIPAVRDGLLLSHETLGLGLLFMAAGAVCSFPVTGRLVDGFGAAGVTRIVAVLYTVSLVLLGCVWSFPALAAALFLFGAAHGSMDVSMNAWGAEVERAYAKPVMPGFHAMWSLGAGLGALSGYAAVGLGLTVLSHFISAGAMVAMLCLWLGRVPWESRRSKSGKSAIFALPSGVLMLVGITAFCAALGEGAVADWSAVFLRDALQADEGTAALGYAVFSAAMVVVRFSGGWLIGILGTVAVARLGGALAAIGATMVVVSGTAALALSGFVLMGLGYAVVMPLAFSRAANDLHIPQGQAIASVATLGYGGLLIGPPVIGFLAELASLRIALGVLVPLAVVIVLLGPVLHPAHEGD